MIARDVDGVAQVSAPSDRLVGGYFTQGYQESGSTFRRSVVTSDWVDDEFEVSRARNPVTITWTVFAETSALHRELLDAVQVDRWFLDVTGDGSVLWACRAADESEPRFYLDGSRTVTLTFSASPQRGY